MKYREVARKLKSLGCEEIRRKGGGSHRKWQNTANNKTAVLPDWGGKDLKLGTVRSFVRQLELDWNEFENT